MGYSGFTFTIGVPTSIFTEVLAVLILGYILFRLTQEVKRLADATEKIYFSNFSYISVMLTY